MSIRIVENRRIAPGTLIIREGDAAREAFVIRSGTAEVLKRNEDGKDVLIGILDAGEIVGEMGLILDRPRSASIRARTAMEVDVVDASCFTALFESDAGRRLRPIVQLLCERLRIADAQRADLENRFGDFPAQPHGVPQPMTVTLIADTADAQAAMDGHATVEIAKFPFRVGRYHDNPDERFFHINDLCLKDPSPSKVSQSHFTLFRTCDSCYLQDRGSKHGSVVNGIAVGGDPENPTRVELKFGKNTLKLGDRRSRLAFTILIESGEPQAFWDRVRGHLHGHH